MTEFMFYGELISIKDTDTYTLKEMLEELSMLGEQIDAQRAIREELESRGE